MAQQIGFCHDCWALSEYDDHDIANPNVRASCRRSRGEQGRSYCGKAIAQLWESHAIAQAILAAYRIAGWNAAVAVWEEAGRPELGYRW